MLLYTPLNVYFTEPHRGQTFKEASTISVEIHDQIPIQISSVSQRNQHQRNETILYRLL